MALSLTKALELHRSGALDESEQLYRQIVAAEPRNADAWHLLGLVEHQRGRNVEAIEHIGRAIELEPARFMYHLNLAMVHSSQGHSEQAIAALEKVIRLDPRHVQAQVEIGVLHANRFEWDEAAGHFRKALAIDPDNAPACNNLGNVLNQLDRPREAIECFERAIRLEPGFARAYNGLGAALYAARRPEEALAAYRRALELDPDSAEAHNNLGQVLGEYGEFAAARAEFEEAARLDPGNASVRNNRGMVALLCGDFVGGWSDYEARWRLPDAKPRPAGPDWQGEQLEGRTILLYTEQGLGDTLQFVRYVPLVKARGGRIVLRCARRMISILSTCEGIDDFSSEDEPFPRFDVSAPLVSLAGIFQTELASIPAGVPYLRARPDLVERWRQTLAGQSAFRVGINWQGHPGYRGDHRRSIPLVEFAPLAGVEGVRLFSLQKGAGVEQLRHVNFAVDDLAGPVDETSEAFVHTAAIIRNLDLVVTSDTALAHLAAALGAPVWVALPLAPDWRWLLDRDDSPWYPTMRLIRQRRLGEWKEVFDAMAERLRALTVDSRSRRT
jgi:tetratricopeptide (TPR) repeat protein